MIDATNDKVAFSGNSTTFIYSLPSLELDCEIKGFRFNAMEVPGVGLVVVRERRRSRPNRILDLGVWIPTVTAERFGVVPDTSPPADPPSYQNFEYTHLVELTPQPNPFLGHSAVLHLDRPDSDSPVLLLLQVDGQTVTLRRFDQAAAVETYTPSKPIYGDAVGRAVLVVANRTGDRRRRRLHLCRQEREHRGPFPCHEAEYLALWHISNPRIPYFSRRTFAA